ncbi:hypothetical protein BFJ70_g8435 [Fusarium oxysporum]|nr:hypothetical protein FOWG_06019 [Fusarium oxysporum f. sp. lycopersici MN25]KAJ4122288.1 hypothetical protein NW765_005119 [Fusarium oxysporum]KAJ4281395.1 hypothetical protein NW764_004088 [Fusarium oxysporum]RKL34480.1 hypothetical protein BFJ70_g8435 [Fusarium oxysporum]
MDHLEPNLERIRVRLRGIQSLTTAEIDLIAQHHEWLTALDERERLALSEEDSPRTWTEDLATFARGCLKALSGETADVDDDMDGSRSRTEHEEDTCMSPDLPEIITLSPEFARHMRDQIRDLPCRAVDWDYPLEILKEGAPAKEDVLYAIRAIMCGWVNELINARAVLEHRIRGVTSENRAIFMLQVPTHLTRMVGVLDIEKDGKIGSYAEWKSLDKGFPTRYRYLWDYIDYMWPILADVRAWNVVSRNLITSTNPTHAQIKWISFSSSRLICIPSDLIIIQMAVPASE